MTTTYSGDPGDSNLDFCRDKLGDVDPADTDDWLLSDEEIEVEIDACPDSLLIACAKCARKIAARFARKVTFSIGRKSKQVGDLADHYYRLAESLEAEALTGTSLSPVPFSGTSTQDPIFRRDLHTIAGAETDDENGVAE